MCKFYITLQIQEFLFSNLNLWSVIMKAQMTSSGRINIYNQIAFSLRHLVQMWHTFILGCILGHLLEQFGFWGFMSSLCGHICEICAPLSKRSVPRILLTHRCFSKGGVVYGKQNPLWPNNSNKFIRVEPIYLNEFKSFGCTSEHIPRRVGSCTVTVVHWKYTFMATFSLSPKWAKKYSHSVQGI